MVAGHRWYACFVDEHYIPSLLMYREVKPHAKFLISAHSRRVLWTVSPFCGSLALGVNTGKPYIVPLQSLGSVTLFCHVVLDLKRTVTGFEV